MKTLGLYICTFPNVFGAVHVSTFVVLTPVCVQSWSQTQTNPRCDGSIMLAYCT